MVVDGLTFILISGQKRIKTPFLHVALSCLKQFQPNWDKSMILHMVPKIFVFNNLALICLVTTDSLATCSESLGQPGVCKTWSVSSPSLQWHRTQSDITLSLNSALIYCWQDPFSISREFHFWQLSASEAQIVNCIALVRGCGVDSHWQQIRKPPTYLYQKIHIFPLEYSLVRQN